VVSEVKMPKLGLTMTKGTIKKWLKNEGDVVKAGEPLLIIETEKITSTVESPASGRLLKILYPPGSTVPVGQVIGYIGEPGEVIPGVPVEKPAAPPKPSVRATPRAKALAEKEGVDLSLVKGSGPEGLITEEDVLRYVQELKVKTTKLGLKVKEVLPMSSLRKTIAERMVSSLREMAQVTLFREENVELLVRLREELLPTIEKETGVRLTYTPMLVKVVAKALKEFPIINSVLEDDQIKIVEEINVGFGVAVDHGLVVPVVKDADKKDLKTVVVECNVLSRKAREGTLTYEEVSGGTFTITNLGMYGVEGFTPIINPPQTAILGVGRIQLKPVVVEGRVEVKPVTVFSLTFDHRVVDGHTAAQFLGKIVEIVTDERKLRDALGIA